MTNWCRPSPIQKDNLKGYVVGGTNRKAFFLACFWLRLSAHAKKKMITWIKCPIDKDLNNQCHAVILGI